MKLHANLTATEVSAAMRAVKDRDLVAPDVHFAVWESGPSRTHAHRYEIQLGTCWQHSLPASYTDQYGRKLHVRRARNSGRGDGSPWAATWHEWGWFMAEIFAADPGARWGQNPDRCRDRRLAWGYSGPADFHAKTGQQFRDAQAAVLVRAAHALRDSGKLLGDHIDEYVFGPYHGHGIK